MGGRGIYSQRGRLHGSRPKEFPIVKRKGFYVFVVEVLRPKMLVLLLLQLQYFQLQHLFQCPKVVEFYLKMKEFWEKQFNLFETK